MTNQNQLNQTVSQSISQPLLCSVRGLFRFRFNHWKRSSP